MQGVLLKTEQVSRELLLQSEEKMLTFNVLQINTQYNSSSLVVCIFNKN